MSKRNRERKMIWKMQAHKKQTGRTRRLSDAEYAAYKALFKPAR